jgi:molybdenum cofactor biosynthesis enzyme MoaA
VVQILKDCGIDKLSVSLLSDNPKQYQQIMKPQTAATFSDVCSFVISSAEAGLAIFLMFVLVRNDFFWQESKSLALLLKDLM